MNAVTPNYQFGLLTQYTSVDRTSVPAIAFDNAAVMNANWTKLDGLLTGGSGGGGGVAEAPNDGNAYLRASAGWSSGGKLKGTLEFDATSNNPMLVLNTNSTGNITNSIAAQKNGLTRMVWNLWDDSNSSTGVCTTLTTYDANGVLRVPKSVEFQNNGVVNFYGGVFKLSDKNYVGGPPGSVFVLSGSSPSNGNRIYSYADANGQEAGWTINMPDSPPTGTASGGGNFTLTCYLDGAVLQNRLNINRATGATTFYGEVILNADPVNPLDAATKQYVDAKLPALVLMNTIDSLKAEVEKLKEQVAELRGRK